MKKERIAIVSGFRSPMGKAGGVFKSLTAHDMGARILKETLLRSGINQRQVDEVIVGNVAQPSEAMNIARVIALRAGLQKSVPAFTVHRNCASGLEAMTSAMLRINSGYGNIIAVGGVESMSNIPLLFNKDMTNMISKLARSKTIVQKLSTLASFRPKFLSPIVGLVDGLTDPVSGMIMGCTAEVLAKEFKITREEQDHFALMSHRKAEAALQKEIFREEIVPIFNNSEHNPKMVEEDEGIRRGQKISDLAKLKPYFEKVTGTVTVGNSSQITDGAAFALMMKESVAKSIGVKPIGYLVDFEYAGVEPERMGLGPVFATSKLFDRTGLGPKDIDLIELNEAFAVQVLACKKAFASEAFASKELGKESAIFDIDDEILNVNGGAISLGHPVGMTGARLVIHMLRELKRRNKNRGLVTMCIGGGQGGAAIVEVN